MLGETITSICSRYREVVLDSSAFDASNASLDSRELYFRQVRDCIIQRERKISTVRETLQEMSDSRLCDYLMRYHGVVELRESLQQEFDNLANSLSLEAFRRGVFRNGVKYPETDVKIATLPFILALDFKKVAFVSADRELNRLVYDFSRGDILNKIKPHVSQRRGVRVYSFLKNCGLCIPYEAELIANAIVEGNTAS